MTVPGRREKGLPDPFFQESVDFFCLCDPEQSSGAEQGFFFCEREEVGCGQISACKVFRIDGEILLGQEKESLNSFKRPGQNQGIPGDHDNDRQERLVFPEKSESRFDQGRAPGIGEG